MTIIVPKSDQTVTAYYIDIVTTTFLSRSGQPKACPLRKAPQKSRPPFVPAASRSYAWSSPTGCLYCFKERAVVPDTDFHSRYCRLTSINQYVDMNSWKSTALAPGLGTISAASITPNYTMVVSSQGAIHFLTDAQGTSTSL